MMDRLTQGILKILELIYGDWYQGGMRFPSYVLVRSCTAVHDYVGLKDLRIRGLKKSGLDLKSSNPLILNPKGSYWS